MKDLMARWLRTPIEIKKEKQEIETHAIEVMKGVLEVSNNTNKELLEAALTNSSILQEKISQLNSRVDKLEERERHFLTRAAVHEAWDQMAFQVLIQNDPNHPPPPPIIVDVLQEALGKEYE